MSSISARVLASLLAGWRDSGVAYAALADRIRLLVVDGRMATGTRLPAERELAAQLGISRTTVTAAYAELRDAGYVQSVRGSGSVITLPLRPAAPLDLLLPEYLDFSKATMPAAPEIAAAASAAARALPRYLGESGFDPFGLARLDLREIEDLVDEPRQTFGFLGDDAEEFLALPELDLGVVEEDFGECADRCERRAQLMGHRRDEVIF